MDYPFAGNPKAQSSPAVRYSDPYRSAAPRHQPSYDGHATENYNDDHGHAADLNSQRCDQYNNRDYGSDQEYADYAAQPQAPPSREHQGYADPYLDAGVNSSSNNNNNNNMALEKDHSPYLSTQNQRDSIWSKQDKRAFAERSGPVKCVRIVFCVLIIGIIFAVSIVSLIVLFARPPNVGISGVGIPSQNGVAYGSGTFSFNVTVDISISNPNSIPATIKKLSATAYDATDRTTSLGSGLVKDAKLKPHTNSTIEFPFQFKYNSTQDKDLSIIKDIASKCGLTIPGLTTASTGNGNLDFDLDIHVDISVIGITIPVSFTHDVSFHCPLSASSIEGALGNLIHGLTVRDADDDDWNRRHFEEPPSQMGTVKLVMASINQLLQRYSGKDVSKRINTVVLHDTL